MWTPPAWPYVNPLDDIKATREEIAGGLQSLSEKIRQLGYDPDEVLAEIAQDVRKLKELGLSLDLFAAQKSAAAPAADASAAPAPAAASGAPQ